MTRPRSANIKILLLATALLIVLGTLFYTQQIVRQLLERERDIAALHARSLEFVANRPADHGADQSDYSFIFSEIIQNIDFPMVLTDSQDHPLPDYIINARNIELDTALAPEQQRIVLEQIVRKLDSQNPPIDVIIRVTPTDSIVQRLHYGESAMVTRLRWLPYIEIIVAGMFILMGYVGFSHIKRSEQSNIWVGMAKETAHQLGTPLSSLMGWLEMLKGSAGEHPKILSTLEDMDRDLQRLQKITDRFSKIGSKPSLREEDLGAVIGSVIEYFQQRLPSRLGQGKNIEISVEASGRVVARINKELFEWVIENLIKNAIDAMEGSSGTITFVLQKKDDEVILDVRDTGKGIDLKSKKDIFRPGYSTKPRGWGLGLSLSKRIIETYHDGKIFVKETRPGRGTTFRIRLRA
ncbi:MAG TPA: HAMP domain-containing sensor histidine kinase [Bacteroidota bacterium]|nr:HAMP domain-containing sensor histidine kinase [Bacteroidota bacterium]